MANMLLTWFFLSALLSQFNAFQPSISTTTDEIIENTDVRLKGKLAIVTGATSGLGRETTLSLATLGCKVVMAVRNVYNAEKVREEILDEIFNGPQRKRQPPRSQLRQFIMIRRLDLDSLESVLEFSKWFYMKFSGIKLDYLFLNAGIMALPDYQQTNDGYEKQIGVNYLSQYYLARLLINKLSQHTIGEKPTGPGRVIVVSSRGHKYAPEPIVTAVDDMERAIQDPNVLKQGYEAWRNYGISKAFQILFARELQRQMGSRGIVAVALHPGVIRSGLQRYMKDEEIASKTFDKDIKQGTATQLWCALMPIEELQAGGYYADCEVHNDRLRDDLKAQEGYLSKSDEEVQEAVEWRLWQISESLVEAKGLTFDFKVPRNFNKEDL